VSWPPGILALSASFAFKATVVLLAALALGRVLRRSSAAHRHLVWASALASLLLLPVAASLLPSWSLPWLPAVADGSLPGSRDLAPIADPSDPIAAPELGSVLFLVWAIGAAAVLARWCAGWIAVARLRRRAFVLRDPSLLAQAADLAKRLNVRRPVTILALEGLAVPLTWGVLRPVILVPASASRWEEERLRLVLAHELGHVARFDVLSQAAAQLALALAWFHPLAWQVARRERAERERACDDLVLSLGARPSRYAGELLAIAQEAGTASPPPAVAAALARPSELEGRLLAILAPHLERGGPTHRCGLGLAAGRVALLGLAMAEPADRADRADPSDSPAAVAPVAPSDLADSRDRRDPPDVPAGIDGSDGINRADPPDPAYPEEASPRGIDST
jgi:beta-lactamase regulating signal transducer with metallopeptidase domain